MKGQRWQQTLALCLLIFTSQQEQVANALTTEQMSSRTTTTTRRSPLSTLKARQWQSYFPEDDNENSGMEKEKQVERPTQTRFAQVGPHILPEKPKIVVLGASGKIGRLVVRQLLECDGLGDATIVALVRDYDKACRVLYDDILVTASPRNRGKPQLQIVQGDLVPPEELPGYDDEDEQHEEDEEWLARASSAASFYGKKVADYDDGKLVALEDSVNESLEDAIRGCTAIISCVGAVRPTNLWTDFLARPLYRILRKDVSSWCNDPRHPYYVNYVSTRKALNFAEKEQVRREAVLEAMEEEGEMDSLKRRTNKHITPRIRFIRISDLCVAQQPWHLVPLLANIMHSMVFRYQDMTERLLESSNLVDTVTLRPGDLCDDERNVTTTSLQIDPQGSLPTPSRVGREDVAALAVASALFTDQDTPKSKGLPSFLSSSEKEPKKVPPFHHTLAVRWAGDEMDPYPAQGRKEDGFADANACVTAALHMIHEIEERETKEETKRTSLSQRLRRKGVAKPHAICAAVPVYLVLFLMTRSLLQAVLPFLPGQRWIMPVVERFGKVFTLMGVFVSTRLRLLVQDWLPALLSFRFRRATPDFISF